MLPELTLVSEGVASPGSVGFSLAPHDFVATKESINISFFWDEGLSHTVKLAI